MKDTRNGEVLLLRSAVLLQKSGKGTSMELFAKREENPVREL